MGELCAPPTAVGGAARYKHRSIVRMRTGVKRCRMYLTDAALYKHINYYYYYCTVLENGGLRISVFIRGDVGQ